jgi:lysophospholipase L1-like esterase
MPVGANGGDSAMVLEYLRGQFAGGRPVYDILLLNSGLHDIKRDLQTGKLQVEPDVYKENLEAILALVVKAGVRPIWIRTTPVNEEMHNSGKRHFKRYSEDVDAYNAAADHIMQNAGIMAIDLYTFTKNLGDGAFSDGVHFNENVRAMQAAFIAGSLYEGAI